MGKRAVKKRTISKKTAMKDKKAGIQTNPKVKEALRKARKLEKHEPMSREEAVSTYKHGISLSEKLRKLLRPSWFVKDLDSKKKKKKKTLNR
ncbi:hypothetical protein ACFLZN_01580 [Nanoarchaeota archaeon]